MYAYIEPEPEIIAKEDNKVVGIFARLTEIMPGSKEWEEGYRFLAERVNAEGCAVSRFIKPVEILSIMELQENVIMAVLGGADRYYFNG